MASPTGPPLRALVVDDEPDTAHSTAELFILHGFRATAATSGAEAVRIAAAEPLDAVLLDLSMPGVDGFEAARRIRAGAQGREPLLVAVTALESAEVRAQAEAAGFDLHLTKPVPPAMLAATARALVGMRRAELRAAARAAERTAELTAAMDALETEMERRRDLTRRLATAQEDERRRVSRDLHDTLGQTLTGLGLAAAAGNLEQVRKLADELSRDLHEVAVRLRPTALDDLGLTAAAQELVSEWSRRSHVPAEFQVVGAGPRPAAEIETVLYRVVQEALTNVARYAGATRVAVLVGWREGAAVAIVEDDGAGFDPSAVPAEPVPGRRGGLGLLGMRERVELLGGVLEVESAPGAGTSIIARIPLAPAESRP